MKNQPHPSSCRSSQLLTLAHHEDLSRLVARGLGLGRLDLVEELLEDPEEWLVVPGTKNLSDEPASLAEEFAGQFQGHEGQVGWSREEHQSAVVTVPTAQLLVPHHTPLPPCSAGVRDVPALVPPRLCQATCQPRAGLTLGVGIMHPAGSHIGRSVIQHHVHLPCLQLLAQGLRDGDMCLSLTPLQEQTGSSPCPCQLSSAPCLCPTPQVG